MHGEEQENTQAEDLDPSSSGRGNVDRRMTANADTLRAAVAEEHEAEHGEHHDSYQGMLTHSHSAIIEQNRWCFSLLGYVNL